MSAQVSDLATIEAKVRDLLPPGNARSRGTIEGVAIRRHAVHFDVAGDNAYCVEDAAQLIAAAAEKS